MLLETFHANGLCCLFGSGWSGRSSPRPPPGRCTDIKHVTVHLVHLPPHHGSQNQSRSPNSAELEQWWWSHVTWLLLRHPGCFERIPLVYQIHTQKTPGGFNYLRKIFSFHSPEMTNCALWTFCSNVLFLSMKDVMIDLRCNESWCWLLTLSLINLPAVKSSCDTWLSQADCDAASRLSLQTPGLYIPHVLNLFLFFCNFRCRRLLLESWEASINSISFSQVDQLGLPITIGKRVFVITFQNNLIQLPSLVLRTLMVLSTTAGSLYKSQLGSLWHLKSTHDIWKINTDKTINKGQAVEKRKPNNPFGGWFTSNQATNLLKYWSFGRRHSFQYFRLFVSDMSLPLLSCLYCLKFGQSCEIWSKSFRVWWKF